MIQHRAVISHLPSALPVMPGVKYGRYAVGRHGVWFDPQLSHARSHGLEKSPPSDCFHPLRLLRHLSPPASDLTNSTNLQIVRRQCCLSSTVTSTHRIFWRRSTAFDLFHLLSHVWTDRCQHWCKNMICKEDIRAKSVTELSEIWHMSNDCHPSSIWLCHFESFNLSFCNFDENLAGYL